MCVGPLTLDLPKPKPTKIVSTVRNYGEINKESFVKSLEKSLSSPPSHSILDGNATCMFEWYNSEMKSLLDKHAPAITSTRTVIHRMPYYNDSIHSSRRERRRAERKWRKSKSEIDREHYLEAKRNVNDLILSAKQAFFKDKLSSCTSKDVYRTINTLLNKNIQHLPYYDSAKELANQFSSYYVNKIVNIRNNLDSENVIMTDNFRGSSNVDADVTPLKVLRPTDEKELLKIINRSPSKTSRLDSIPTWFLKENISQLLPLLTNIVNASLSLYRHFPEGSSLCNHKTPTEKANS